MTHQDERINQAVVLLLVVFISAIFLSMIRQFLMSIFMAGIFSALAQPIYLRLVRLFGGRRAPASMTTLLLIVLVVLLPLGILIGIVTAQAFAVSQSVQPAVEKFLATPTIFSDYLDRIPHFDKIVAYKEVILRKAGTLVGSITRYLMRNLGSGALGTVNFLFMFFIMLYTMFFFLMDGHKLLARILYYLPLQNDEEQQLLGRFTSVTRATIKGTIVICILHRRYIPVSSRQGQGVGAGISFHHANGRALPPLPAQLAREGSHEIKATRGSGYGHRAGHRAGGLKGSVIEIQGFALSYF